MGFPESTIAAKKSGFVELRHVEVTGSTNTDLADESRQGSTAPVVLVADHQTAGRGRLDRDWIDAGESLLVSVRMLSSADEAHSMMDAVSAAARHAVDWRMIDEVLFKWPNDLVVDRDGIILKLAGTLAEWVDSDPPVVVVGVGINIGPAPIDLPAAYVNASAGRVSRDRLLADMLSAIPPRLTDPALTRAETRSHSATLGRRVRVSTPGGVVLAGLATDLTDAGHLLVVDDSGDSHQVSVGDVVHLRPVDPG